ncbi:DoxX family protein [Streptomyces sp. NBC_00878]|uniref:DoxX family protein n=1 Tax=Streptomyces sp. NBC_00878 TaxID=2975854 RepID=UPI002250ED8F|nr:DoxX family protein [Streptomyces sp. NBC_00878]MCX4904391.1 DoxX family protein [Streptomyces sp. NBC_00878]
MMNILMLAGAVFGAGIAASGALHVIGYTRFCTPATTLGFSPAAARAIGVYELIGGAALCAGFWFPVVATTAAVSLFLLTAAAVQYHHWNDDRPRRLVLPALTSMVMLTYAAVTIMT